MKFDVPNNTKTLWYNQTRVLRVLSSGDPLEAEFLPHETAAEAMGMNLFNVVTLLILFHRPFCLSFQEG